MTDTDVRAVRVVRGDPSAEELAVVIALVNATAGSTDEPAPALRGRWSDPAHALRGPLHPGPGAWRSSLR